MPVFERNDSIGVLGQYVCVLALYGQNSEAQFEATSASRNYGTIHPLPLLAAAGFS